MNREMTSDAIIENLEKIASAPESITDQELKDWNNDPEMKEALQTMLLSKHALLEQVYSKDLSHQAFREFEEQHRNRKAAVIVRLWKASVLVAAACLAGWLVLPSLIQKTPTINPANIIYQATAEADDVVISDGQSEITATQLAEQVTQKRRINNVVMKGDTIVYLPVENNKFPVNTSTIQIPQGQTVKLALADGTLVWLNTKSNLKYPNIFPSKGPRVVELEGEAYFEVAHNEKQPFIVNCGELQTTVLGTTLNIRNYPESPTCVTLVNGSVKVATPTQQVTLNPSQSATLEKSGKIKTAQADLESILCWKEGQFFFDGKTLQHVLYDMARWYNCDVVVNDDTHLKDRLHFRGERNWKLEDIVESLNIICDIDLELSNGVLVLN